MDKSGINISLLLCCLASLVMPAQAADDLVSREYKIKAAYLYNLIKFVNWPNTPENDNVKSTNICVYGHNPFDRHLDKLTARKAKGLPIAVSYREQNQATENCHIVFITKKNQSLENILKNTPNSSLLLVGEDRDFLDRGGLISMIVAENNVQLQINLTEAKKLGFEISGNLLEIAKTIK